MVHFPNIIQKGLVHILLLIAGVILLLFFLTITFAPFKNQLFGSLFPKQFSFAATNPILSITDNTSSYPNNQVPKYDKFEVTFEATTSAKNMFYPYDASPPAGLSGGDGVTINAEFSQDNFATKAIVPAFYYQDFDYQVKSGKDWIYPKNQYFWKVRFAPPKPGNWQYKLTKTDSSGTFTTPPLSFTVSDSANKGFIRVSPKDSRYFEYEDGSYFPALGYNMNFDRIKWDDPVQANKNNFQIMGQNGPLLIRQWLSQWGIWSASVSPWRSLSLGSEAESMSTRPAEADNGRSSVMEIKWPATQNVWPGNPCMSLGWLHEAPAQKPNTKYQIDITYRIPDTLSGPNVAGQPFGFVAKTAGWLAGSFVKLPTGTTWRANQECAYPATLVNQLNPGNQEKILTSYITDATSGWATTSATFTSGNGNYLPMLYLALENVTGSTVTDGTGSVFIDNVSIREDLGGGQFGANLLDKGNMDYLSYADQKYSYAFDLVLDLAKQNNVYLKLVGMEKNESIQNSINFSGVGGSASTNNNFYGNGRNMTKIRWLQQAWWRYMQARWGYSTNIQSWELLNEGDPFNGNHATLTDEFGKYMHQFGNKHLSTTSTWNEFPTTPFFSNPSFPDIDYGDIHQYMVQNLNKNTRTDKNALFDSVNTFQIADWFDSAAATERISQALGAKKPQGINKPMIRGETGFVINNSDGWQNIIQNDTSGKWLQKFLWATLNSGGLIENYWYDKEHIYPSGSDKRPIFGRVNNFLKDIPLNNGNYIEAAASATDSNLRMMGQKDLVNKRAHLWIDNKTDTWGNLINSIAPTNVTSATVTIPNMPQGSYPVAWIDTYTGLVSKNETVIVGANGNLNLAVSNLSTDIAVKIGDYSTAASPQPSVSPSPSPSPAKPGDIDGNNKVDIFDYNILLTNFGKSGSGIQGDLDGNNKVDIFDYNLLLTNFGK